MTVTFLSMSSSRVTQIVATLLSSTAVKDGNDHEIVASIYHEKMQMVCIVSSEVLVTHCRCP